MTSSPSCAGKAACRPAVECYRPRQTTDDDRRQRSKQYCPYLCVGRPVIRYRRRECINVNAGNKRARHPEYTWVHPLKNSPIFDIFVFFKLNFASNHFSVGLPWTIRERLVLQGMLLQCY